MPSKRLALGPPVFDFDLDYASTWREINTKLGLDWSRERTRQVACRAIRKLWRGQPRRKFPTKIKKIKPREAPLEAEIETLFYFSPRELRDRRKLDYPTWFFPKTYEEGALLCGHPRVFRGNNKRSCKECDKANLSKWRHQRTQAMRNYRAAAACNASEDMVK